MDKKNDIYAQILDIMPDPLIILQEDRHELVNLAFTRVFGYTREDFAEGVGFFVLVQDKDLEEIRRRYREKMPKSGVSEPYEVDLKAKNGTIVCCETVASSIEFQGREAHMVLFRDVGERKRSEERMKFLSQIVEQVTDPVMATDMEFKITYINRAFQQLTGYSIEDVSGQSPHILNAELMRDSIQQTISSGETWRGEMLCRMKDGTVIPCELMAFPLVDDSGKPYAFAGNLRDISVRREHEEMLSSMTADLKSERQELTDKNIALKQILEHVENQKETFRQQVAHDFEQTAKPVLKKLKKKLSGNLRQELGELETILNAVLSGNQEEFALRFSRLTSRESQICGFIKEGRSSKEISEDLHLSLFTVLKHREHIRDKLGLRGLRISLPTYLKAH